MTTLPHHSASAAIQTADVVTRGSGDNAVGLILSGELLFGGVLLIAISAYALRRLRP